MKAPAKKRRIRVVNVNVNPFRLTHKQLPRGIAFWVFYFKDAPDEPWIPRRADMSWKALTFLDAKREAIDEARRRCVSAIKLDPYPL